LAKGNNEGTFWLVMAKKNEIPGQFFFLSYEKKILGWILRRGGEGGLSKNVGSEF